MLDLFEIAGGHPRVLDWTDPGSTDAGNKLNQRCLMSDGSNGSLDYYLTFLKGNPSFYRCPGLQCEGYRMAATQPTMLALNPPSDSFPKPVKRLI